jgi:hypothetical protein
MSPLAHLQLSCAVPCITVPYHYRPHTFYLIEGIRRSLVKYSHRGPDGGGPAGGHLPPILYVQADSAGDNKSQWIICWFAWLVQEGYVSEVILSFLVVGHTHEDVDQTFSLGSKFLYKNAAMIFTYDGFVSALSSAYHVLDATFDEVKSVLDWKAWFGAHEGKYGKEMNARACMRHWSGLGTSKDNETKEKHAVHSLWVCSSPSTHPPLAPSCVPPGSCSPLLLTLLASPPSHALYSPSLACPFLPPNS